MQVKGTVYDQTALTPIEAVTVHSTLGNISITDSFGKYQITVRPKDSIWFTMLGKNTKKFYVDTITNPEAFDIKIHLYNFNLPEVKVRSHYYRLDSLQNRQDYAKIFNFKKPSFSLLSNANSAGYVPGSLTGAFDLASIIDMFNVKKNRSIAKLQERLVLQEQEKYVESRVNKNLVRKLTKLQGDELNNFMQYFKPNYWRIIHLNDIELGMLILREFEMYKQKPL